MYQDPKPPYLCIIDPHPGGPKTRGSGGSGCATLFFLLADFPGKSDSSLRWNSLTAFLVKVTGHILKSSQTQVFVWFSTVLQNSNHEQAGFLVKRLQSFVNAIHEKTRVFLFCGFFARIFKTREDRGFNQIPPVEGTVNSMEQNSSLSIN